MRHDVLSLCNDALDGQGQGAAARDGTAAAKGANPLLDHQGVAVSNRHMVHGNAHLVSHNLGKHGLMTLAVGTGTGKHGDLSGALHPNGTAFKTAATARLHKGRDAAADQFTT